MKRTIKKVLKEFINNVSSTTKLKELGDNHATKEGFSLSLNDLPNNVSYEEINCELVENLEKFALLPVIGWSSQNQIEFFLPNSKLQTNAVHLINEKFPEVVDELDLIKVYLSLYE